MITRKNLSKIYDWAKNTEFPLKKVPTAGEYSNKDIFICWLKGAGKKVLLRKKLMTDEVLDIFSDENIIIPSKNHCFMIWDNQKVTWREGVAQTYHVMDVIHEGYNLSTKPMEFVMIDVKIDTVIEDENNSQ